MEEERLESIVAKLGDKLLEYLQSAEDVIATNTPELIQEIYTYFLTMSWIWGSVGLFLFIVSTAIFVFLGVRNAVDLEDWIGFSIAYAIPALISGLMLIKSTINIIKINLAPKLFLIEKIKDLL